MSRRPPSFHAALAVLAFACGIAALPLAPAAHDGSAVAVVERWLAERDVPFPEDARVLVATVIGDAPPSLGGGDFVGFAARPASSGAGCAGIALVVGVWVWDEPQVRQGPPTGETFCGNPRLAARAPFALEARPTSLDAMVGSVDVASGSLPRAFASLDVAAESGAWLRLITGFGYTIFLVVANVGTIAVSDDALPPFLPPCADAPGAC